jgi:hypothetical protein
MSDRTVRADHGNAENPDIGRQAERDTTAAAATADWPPRIDLLAEADGIRQTLLELLRCMTHELRRRTSDPAEILYRPDKIGNLLASSGKTLLTVIGLLDRLHKFRAEVAARARRPDPAERPDADDTLGAIRRARE